MKQVMEGVGQWALVTGASGGIGYEMCRLLAQHGYNVALVSRDASRLAVVARELEEACGVRTLVMPKDLSTSSASAEIYKEVKNSNINLDVLINNAGFGELSLVAEGDLEVQRQMMQVNMASLVELTHLFLPEMIERKRGGILNVGSTGSFLPVPYMAVYGATKAFVLSFSEALSAEVEGTGVTVTALCPGVTETGFARRARTENTLLVRLNRMNAADVARAGYDALMKGKATVVPGWFNKLMIGSLRFSPRCANLKMGKALLKPSISNTESKYFQNRYKA